MDTIKVSAKSRSTAVAGAIAGVIREYHKAEVQAIGAGAVNQAIKAIAIARSYLQQDQLDLAVVPTFAEVDINGEERTAVRMYIESRATDEAPDVPRSNGHHAETTELEAV
jgi:stage V sporulation protein S